MWTFNVNYILFVLKIHILSLDWVNIFNSRQLFMGFDLSVRLSSHTRILNVLHD